MNFKCREREETFVINFKLMCIGVKIIKLVFF